MRVEVTIGIGGAALSTNGWITIGVADVLRTRGLEAIVVGRARSQGFGGRAGGQKAQS